VLPWVRYVPGLTRRAWFDPGVSAQFRPQKFLLLFALVTLVFFSLSGSKLAPYILPMMPVLAALAGVHAESRPEFTRHVSGFAAGMLFLCAIGMCIYSVAHSGNLPQPVLTWSTVAAALGACAAIPTQLRMAPARGVLLLCVASVLGWQCLLTAFSAVPPLRTGKELVAAIGEEIKPQTPLYSVGQYRHSLTWYLRRNLVLVGFEGELEFGIGQEPGKESMSRTEFLARWRASSDGVAFFSPKVYDDYRMLGFTGRILLKDGTTVVVSRNE
jgi:4-amino-4-deoxy-L-arabinose transferase-like glycosyltransferase